MKQRLLPRNDQIMEKMSESCQHNAAVKFVDGKVLDGFVDTFESRYDNDGEASICFAGVNGEMLIIEEQEIADVVVTD